MAPLPSFPLFFQFFESIYLLSQFHPPLSSSLFAFFPPFVKNKKWQSKADLRNQRNQAKGKSLRCKSHSSSTGTFPITISPKPVPFSDLKLLLLSLNPPFERYRYKITKPLQFNFTSLYLFFFNIFLQAPKSLLSLGAMLTSTLV